MSQQIIIAWMQKGDNDSIFTLGWNNGQGPTRVYDKDRYDARLDMGRDRDRDGPLPCFANYREAMAWMLANRGEQCQVTVPAAMRLGLVA
jgi:hypothetical protein